MQQQNRKTPVVFRIGLALLCVALCSFHLTGGLYARYTSNAQATATARVAFVTASASGEVISDSNVIDPAAKTPYEFKVTVSNEKDGKIAEVALGYTIYVDLPDGFPTMDIFVSDAVKNEENSTATCLVFESEKLLAADSSSTNEHIVSFVGTNETIGIYRGLPITVRVKAEQVD